jgi:hypothetical protein
MMVAMAVTAILVVLLVNVTGTVSNAWKRGESQAETSSNARGALGMMSRELKSALIDLDLGFRILTVPTADNNFKLKFLTRAEPTADGTPAVKKVCYQLAWADSGLVPRIYTEYAADHSVPVLVRTESTNLDDVFDVNSSNPADKWTLEFGEIPEGGVNASESLDPKVGVTEVVAENVVGWRVVPQYWDETLQIMKADDPKSGSQFYDKYLTSDIAPRAIEIVLAVVPTRELGPITNFEEEWGGIHSNGRLFSILESTSSEPFTRLLRQHIRFFPSTVYLQSKTP